MSSGTGEGSTAIYPGGFNHQLASLTTQEITIKVLGSFVLPDQGLITGKLEEVHPDYISMFVEGASRYIRIDAIVWARQGR